MATLKRTAFEENKLTTDNVYDSNEVHRIFSRLPTPDSRLPTPDSLQPRTKLAHPIDNCYINPVSGSA
ncbi:hypothetical protein [Moorena producens]|uniref:hypothetical protein n=1 Tax=Moorena producens TaxID=1155739 RepID=UPI003C765DBC